MQNNNQLQEDLEKINNWCKEWIMSLNKYKRKLIHFTKKKTTLSFNYFLDSDLIETATVYKYLGVRLTSDLPWNNHIEVITADSSGTLGLSRRNLKRAPPFVRKLTLDTYVRPKIEYASTIWNTHRLYLINTL